jgi:hypothetical protein
MVDESLIAYLKNELLKEVPGYVDFGKSQTNLFGNAAKKGQLSLETKIEENPFKENEETLELQLHQLYANIGIENSASLLLFATFGFQKIGVKKDWNLHNGKFSDEALFQLINQK